jgi:hypothetical protein
MSKYKKGDYVVCLEDMGYWVKNGEICILGGPYWNKRDVNEKGYLKAITVESPKGNGCSVKCEFRHATQKEINAYNQGIRFIQDITNLTNYEIY